MKPRGLIQGQMPINRPSVIQIVMTWFAVIGLSNNTLVAEPSMPKGSITVQEHGQQVQPTQSQLSDSTMNPSMVELQKRLSAVNSLTADFVQKTLTDSAQRCSELAQSGSDKKALHGQMNIARPGKLYWKTEPPFEQQTLADGKTLWVYDPDLEQVTMKQLDASLQQSPAAVLSGSIEDIAHQYDVYGSETSNESWKFALIPKSHEALFSRLELTFDQQNRISSMLIDDGLGQKTCFRFSNVNYNAKLPEALFRFEIPKGVDVIHESGFLGPKSQHE